MSLTVISALVGGAICSAAGPLLFAAGARGRTEMLSFHNMSIIAGLGLYALGTIFWIYSLSRAQLIQVYPFTALTFVLIYFSGILFLGENLEVYDLCGIILVLIGLSVNDPVTNPLKDYLRKPKVQA
jgi:drug/metabolite transporter (DMT)-like permease